MPRSSARWWRGHRQFRWSELRECPEHGASAPLSNADEGAVVTFGGGGVGVLEALAGTRGTAPAIARDAQVPAQILERLRTCCGGFVNLAFGDGVADANVHGGSRRVCCE